MKTFLLFDDIDRTAVENMATFLATEIADGDSIKIDLMSYGGDVFSGLALAEMLIEARKRGIQSTVVVYGLAASAAAIMALAADHVIMTDIGSMMLHGVYHENARGNIVTKGDDVDRANAACLALIQRRCPSYTLKTLLTKDHWYTAQEAKDMGLIDEIRHIESFSDVQPLKNMISGFINAAVHAIKPDGGVKMNKRQNEIDELDVETQIEEQDEKLEELEDEGEDAVEAEPDLKSVIVDGMNAILDRLAALEAKIDALAPVVEAEADEEEHEEDDIMSAKIRAMYNKIGKVSAPCVKRTRDEAGDSRSELKAAADRVKKVFPNIAKYYAD